MAMAFASCVRRQFEPTVPRNATPAHRLRRQPRCARLLREWDREDGMRLDRTLAVLAVIAWTCAPAAHAQDYPSKPITLVLPLGAGGAMDILARGQFAPKLSERLGKPVVVENRTGGSTVIA